jgi:hypothetical protein
MEVTDNIGSTDLSKVNFPQFHGRRVSTFIYVNADSGNDNNNGSAVDRAFATVTKALSVAEPGDTLILGAGSYDEEILIEVDYVDIIGARSGYGRPDITPASGIPITVRAQGVVCRQLRFASDDDDCALIEGNGFDFDDCVFDGDNTASKGGVRLKGNATDDHFTSSEGRIRGSLFRGNALGLIFDTAEAAVGVGSTDNVIRENKFVDNTLDIVTRDTGPGVYSVQRAVIERNVFADKNKATYIDLTTENGGAAGDQSGIIVDNFFAADALDGTRIKMAGTGFVLVGNRTTVGIADGSGLD